MEFGLAHVSAVVRFESIPIIIIPLGLISRCSFKGKRNVSDLLTTVDAGYLMHDVFCVWGLEHNEIDLAPM